MFELVEVTYSMVKEACFFGGRIHNYGLDTSCRYHVVERIIEPDGDWEMSVVNSFDDVHMAFSEVWERALHCADITPEGWTYEHEIWHVNEHRYFLYDAAHSFCEYFDALPQWLYCVEDWDGTKLFDISAEGWEETAKLYSYGLSLSSPSIESKRFCYHDRLNGALNFEAYFPVVTVKCS